MTFLWQNFAIVAEFWNIQNGWRGKQWVSKFIFSYFFNTSLWMITSGSWQYINSCLVELWIHFDHEKIQETFHGGIESCGKIKYCFQIHCRHLVITLQYNCRIMIIHNYIPATESRTNSYRHRVSRKCLLFNLRIEIFTRICDGPNVHGTVCSYIQHA